MKPGNVKKNKPAQRAQAKTELLHEMRRQDVTRKDETGQNDEGQRGQIEPRRKKQDNKAQKKETFKLTKSRATPPSTDLYAKPKSERVNLSLGQNLLEYPRRTGDMQGRYRVGYSTRLDKLG